MWSTVSLMSLAGVSHNDWNSMQQKPNSCGLAHHQSLRSLSQSNRTFVIGTKILQAVESVRDLSMYLDSRLSKQTYMAKVMQTCFFRLRCLRQIRQLIRYDITANITQADTTGLWQCYTCQSAILDPCNAAACHQCCYAAGFAAFSQGTMSLMPPSSCTGCCVESVQAVSSNRYWTTTPSYVAKLLQPVTELPMRHTSPQSANKNNLFVPRIALKSGKQVFSAAGPAAFQQTFALINNTPG